MASENIIFLINKYLEDEVNESFTRQKEKLLQQFSEELESKRSEYVRKICDSIDVTRKQNGLANHELTFSITIVNQRR